MLKWNILKDRDHLEHGAKLADYMSSFEIVYLAKTENFLLKVL